jgi:hypothetical protein
VSRKKATSLQKRVQGQGLLLNLKTANLSESSDNEKVQDNSTDAKDFLEQNEDESDVVLTSPTFGHKMRI